MLQFGDRLARHWLTRVNQLSIKQCETFYVRLARLWLTWVHNLFQILPFCICYILPDSFSNSLNFFNLSFICFLILFLKYNENFCKNSIEFKKTSKQRLKIFFKNHLKIFFWLSDIEHTQNFYTKVCTDKYHKGKSCKKLSNLFF